MRRIEEYKTTTNSRVYNIISLHGLDCDCCLRCERRRRRGSYRIWEVKRPHYVEDKETRRIYVAGYNTYIDKKYPSWKLCTRNRKQWMKKKLKFKPGKHYPEWIGIEW